jgi:hypothetical protein
LTKEEALENPQALTNYVLQEVMEEATCPHCRHTEYKFVTREVEG